MRPIRRFVLCGICLILAAGLAAGCRPADPPPQSTYAPTTVYSTDTTTN